MTLTNIKGLRKPYNFNTYLLYIYIYPIYIYKYN